MEQLLQKLTQKHNLGVIVSTSLMPNENDIVYKMITTQNEYIIKIFTEQIDIKKLNDKIIVSEMLNQMGIKCILPMKISEIYIGNEDNASYVIYPNYNLQIIPNESLTTTKLAIIAQTLARIHQVNIKTALNPYYQKIKINLNKNINDESLKQIIKQYSPIIKEAITNCNKSIKYAKKRLCINHNDIKYKNLFWNQDELYITNFDYCSYANPYASLIEAAFNMCNYNYHLNLDFYNHFIKSYLVLNPLNMDSDKLLYASLNGKLQLFKKLLEQEETQKRNENIKQIINELTIFYNNKLNLTIPFKN